MGGGREGQRPSLDTSQCDFCKELGHYTSKCPKNNCQAGTYEANQYKNTKYNDDYQEDYNDEEDFNTLFVGVCSAKDYDNDNDDEF